MNQYKTLSGLLHTPTSRCFSAQSSVLPMVFLAAVTINEVPYTDPDTRQNASVKRPERGDAKWTEMTTEQRQAVYESHTQLTAFATIAEPDFLKTLKTTAGLDTTKLIDELLPDNASETVARGSTISKFLLNYLSGSLPDKKVAKKLMYIALRNLANFGKNIDSISIGQNLEIKKDGDRLHLYVDSTDYGQLFNDVVSSAPAAGGGSSGEDEEEDSGSTDTEEATAREPSPAPTPRPAASPSPTPTPRPAPTIRPPESREVPAVTAEAVVAGFGTYQINKDGTTANLKAVVDGTNINIVNATDSRVVLTVTFDSIKGRNVDTSVNNLKDKITENGDAIWRILRPPEAADTKTPEQIAAEIGRHPKDSNFTVVVQDGKYCIKHSDGTIITTDNEENPVLGDTNMAEEALKTKFHSYTKIRLRTMATAARATSLAR